MNIKEKALWLTLPLGMSIVQKSSADVKEKPGSNPLNGWSIKS
jgi:hypothetical protein